MIVKYFSNNLDCLCWVEKINNKYFYVDGTKGLYYEVKADDVEKIE